MHTVLSDKKHPENLVMLKKKIVVVCEVVSKMDEHKQESDYLTKYYFHMLSLCNTTMLSEDDQFSCVFSLNKVYQYLLQYVHLIR